MRYVLLVIEDGEERRNRPLDEGRQAYDRMVRFSETLKARGVLQATESLKTEAVRVEVRGGKRIVVDGPFAETKEMVGGFFLLECASRAEALAIAGECPATEWASVEVRELGPCFS
jgi:hypothetical protein